MDATAAVEETLPHHEQQSLCTTRLPYRQGRKLTAVKVYTINNESNHLLIFGVPSLNLRQETKALFLKFGKLLQFHITKHKTEPFTETFHAVYDRIQSSRIAKRMLDTKNFYGGSLHVCYAPELENADETHQKLMQRQKDVLFRLRNLEKDALNNKNLEKDSLKVKEISDVHQLVPTSKNKLNMGEENMIMIGNNKKSKKRKIQSLIIEEACEPCSVKKISKRTVTEGEIRQSEALIEKKAVNNKEIENLEVVDCTSVDKETVTNVNECLNYNNFGNEIVRKVPEKPVNRIKFYVGNKNA